MVEVEGKLPGAGKKRRIGIGLFTEDEYIKYKQTVSPTLKNVDLSLDGYSALGLPENIPPEKEKEWKEKFLTALDKLLDPEKNWTFYRPFKLVWEYCARCQTCAEACPVYIASGRKEIYRPTYRLEVLQRIYRRYRTWYGKMPLLRRLMKADIELNSRVIKQLAELSYRCTQCRRCALYCPLGLDQGLVDREIRKMLSQELNIHAKELHELGTVQQLNVGSSTGMSPKAFLKVVKFLEEMIKEKTGLNIKIPVDEKGADYLLIHNAGEYLSWPENPAAFAILFELAGVSYTLSSEPVGYDAVNYGVWYNDIQLYKVAKRHFEIARKLEVKALLIGECGHAWKAILTAERVIPKEERVPFTDVLIVMDDIVRRKKLNLDPNRNNFPVTLHDPCNKARKGGIVEEPRRIIQKVVPEGQFREMEPHGFFNYCCGGGSGFAIMHPYNFDDWKMKFASYYKVKQIMDAFRDVLHNTDIPKYVCAPCSNCKGELRDMIAYYALWDKFKITYGGLVELIVNAIADIPPFLELEFH